MSIKKLTICMIILLISGCATTKTDVACDFIDGASDNAQKRHKEKDDYTIHGDKKISSRNSDTHEGILSVLSGVLTRSLTSNSKNDCN